MTYPFLDDFARRREQVRRYLAVVSHTERRVRPGEARKLEIDRLHVVRAGTFLILYNLVEASTRAALEAIHDALSTGRIPFTDLNDGIRREIILGFKRKGNPDTHIMMIDLPVEFVSASLDVEHHFSGNVDAKFIRGLADKYGFSHNTEYRRTHGGYELLNVKEKRNDLAHGVVSYDDVGRLYTFKDLLSIGLFTTTYIDEILKNISIYLDRRSYLKSPPT